VRFIPVPQLKSSSAIPPQSELEWRRDGDLYAAKSKLAGSALSIAESKSILRKFTPGLSPQVTSY
jgi:hypothetical protein